MACLVSGLLESRPFACCAMKRKEEWNGGCVDRDHIFSQFYAYVLFLLLFLLLLLLLMLLPLFLLLFVVVAAAVDAVVAAPSIAAVVASAIVLIIAGANAVPAPPSIPTSANDCPSSAELCSLA